MSTDEPRAEQPGTRERLEAERESLEAEITAQLAYTAEWGAQLVYPLPTLHVVTPGSGDREGEAS